MMDFKVLDRARRNVGPLQVDLVESYAQGRISRRGFLKRGAVLGLSLPFMSAIIAACGSDDNNGTAGGGTGSTPGTTPTSGAPSGGIKTGGTIKVASQSPAGPLDPPTMIDLSSYGLIAQCFEYLAALGDNGSITAGLAETWTPNDDGSMWTFKLRQGVKWQDGSDFTADDVVATMERMVTNGNAQLSGIIEAGSAVAKDPSTVEFTLAGPNGNFPYLVSVFNSQACITPKDYAIGTTLNDNPNGTGPWKLTKYDASTGATFVRNDAWWGGKTYLDSTEWLFSDDIATQVTGIQGGATDAIVQFSVVGGDALLNDPNFNVLAVESATHREIWMRCDEGQFVDKQVRQALAYSLDRELMLSQLFKGKGEIANDHPIASFYEGYDGSVPQRTRDVEKAKQLLADAGKTGLKATLSAPQLQEIPQLAELVQSNAKEAGIDITLDIQGTDTFYNSWCATYPCAGGVEFGIVDYGHRPTPDVYLTAAYSTGGEWNSAQYSSADFDAALKEFQAATDVAGHQAACKKLETIANEDTPNAIPYFYNYLSGNSNKFTGVRVSALGQMFLDQAGQIE
jgi:peptide/nickel transport system substrate-binding protein